MGNISEKLTFIKEYISNWRSVGAIAPSSKNLANKMVEGIDFEHADCIIEFGPGTGVFTQNLVNKKKDDTHLFLVEYNSNFCNILKQKYGENKNIHIINDSAEHIDTYLKKQGIEGVDYIVSGLPFASLPKTLSENILKKSNRILKQNGEFITFQYTLVKKDFINTFFDSITLSRVLKNLPPAYIFSCKKMIEEKS